MLTPEEFEQRMQKIAEECITGPFGLDEETCHIRMDDLMCILLRDLGYGSGIDIFDKAPKYYG